MTRVKRGTTSNKTRRTTLKAVKGYRFGRSKKERQANEAIAHAGAYSFAHRRDKKTDIRGLWQIHIGAYAKQNGLSYSKLIHLFKVKSIKLNRKILSGLVGKHPDTMKRVVAAAVK